MNDYVLSVILGVVEGLTEFIPVSSTAHLRLSEWLLHVDLGSGYWKMYTIVIQLGAILTLPIYFRERIAKFIATFPRGRAGRPDDPDASLEPGDDCVCGDGDSVVSADEGDWEKPGESVRDGERAADWRNCDVVCGCAKCEVGDSGRGSGRGA